MLQEGQQLDRFAQAHVVGQAGALIEAMQEGQPAQTALLIGPQLSGEPRGRRQGIGGFLLVVLLQHRLQAGPGREGMDRQAGEGLPFIARDPQGVIEAEGGLSGAELLGVLEVQGPQFDPGPLVLHQRAALGRELLEVLQVQRDPADHEFPAPLQGFPEGEAAGLLGQLGGDGQAQAAGQTTGEARGEHHPDAHIPQAGRGGSHQDEGLRGGELHRLGGGGIQAPLQGLKGQQGAAQALQQ